MTTRAENIHVSRPTPTIGVVLGVLVCAGVSLPGAVLAPAEYFAKAGAWIIAICALLATGLILLGLRRVECVRDPEARELTITWLRWPFPTKKRVIPYDAIVNIAVVQYGRGRHLVIEGLDDARISLVVASAPDTAAVLRAWLGRSAG